MKLLHCTNKQISELNTYIQPKDELHENNGLGDWYANIFVFNRRNNLFFVNSKTHCGFVVPDLLKKDQINFHDYFIKGVSNLLEWSGANKELINQIIVEYIHLQIVKTESKSILGSMNDYIQLYKFIFKKNQGNDKWTTERFNKNLNLRPSGALKFALPMEKLQELLLHEYKSITYKK